MLGENWESREENHSFIAKNYKKKNYWEKIGKFSRKMFFNCLISLEKPHTYLTKKNYIAYELMKRKLKTIMYRIN